MTEKGYGYQRTFHADMFFQTIPVGHEDEQFYFDYHASKHMYQVDGIWFDLKSFEDQEGEYPRDEDLAEFFHDKFGKRQKKWAMEGPAEWKVNCKFYEMNFAEDGEEYTDEEYDEKHFDTIREMKEKVTFVGKLTLT